ncbi:hypothetical protein ES703_78927 [subsurface metagenome]
MRIKICQLPPNEYSPNWRGDWAQRYKAGQVYQEAVYYECVNERNKADKWKPVDRATVNLTFIFPCLRKRDEDNLRTRFKPGLDAMVKAGLITDDDMKHLNIGKVKVLVDPKLAPLTIIDIRDNGILMADETDKCPPHWWKLTTDKDGNEVHQCCKCPARKVVERDRLDKSDKDFRRVPKVK